MDKLFSKQIVFVGGKGGVGKSTSAAALALTASRSGKKTLLVSTDPAHNVGDIFHQQVGGKVTKIIDNLFALEIDPGQETKAYIKTVKDNLKGMVKPGMIEEVHRQIDTVSSTPGAEEAAIFDKIVSIVLHEREKFDLIIFDTAPTGHTIRLLSLPELMGVWIDGMLERRKKINDNYTQLLNDGEPVEDPIYDVLQARRQKFADVREILLDLKQTGYVFVLNPERLPILETEKALKMMDAYHLHVKHLIVNKVLPETADGDFLAKRRKQEQSYMELLEKTFSKQKIIKIPLFEEDISSLEKLKTFSTYMDAELASS